MRQHDGDQLFKYRHEYHARGAVPISTAYGFIHAHDKQVVFQSEDLLCLNVVFYSEPPWDLSCSEERRGLKALSPQDCG